jgi:hypothetical protein
MTHAAPDPSLAQPYLSGSPELQSPAIQRGPGVVPPFVAPPREGVKRRRWIGVGVGVAIGVLCCGGGGVAFVGLSLAIRHQQLTDAQTVVTKYLDDKKNAHFASAYQLLCAGLKDQYTLAEFTAQVIKEPIIDFVVAPALASGNAATVSVSIDYINGSNSEEEYEVVLNSDNDSRVCGGTAL